MGWKKIKLLLFILLSSLIIINCNSSNLFAADSPEETFNKAVEYLKNDNTKKAEKQFKKIINKSNDHYPSFYNLSLIKYKEKNYDEALKFLTRAYELNPFDIQLSKMLANTYSQLDDLPNAKKIMSAINTRHPSDLNAHKLLGIYYLKEKKALPAIAEFTITKNLAPSDIQGNLLLSAAYSQNNNYKVALKKTEPIKDKITENHAKALYAHILDKNYFHKEAKELLQNSTLSLEDDIPTIVINQFEEQILNEELARAEYKSTYKNLELTKRMANKIKKESIPVQQQSQATQKSKNRPLNWKATLTETWEHYNRRPRTTSPINGLNVTSNIKIEGKTKEGVNLSGEWEHFSNRWDDGKIDYFKINANKRNDFALDLGKFSAKYFPSLVSYPTVLEGARVYKKISPKKFEPTQSPEINLENSAPINLGEIYKKHHIDQRNYKDVELTVVIGKTQERQNIGDRREKNENTYETSGKFEQWTQSYRAKSKINTVFEIGSSLSLTQDVVSNTTVSSSTAPIKSMAYGLDAGIDLLDNKLNLDAEVAYSDYDLDRFDQTDKHERGIAWLLKSKYKMHKTLTFNYEQKKIGQNFKVEGASQTQDKISHTIDLLYKPVDPKTWLPQAQSISYKPEIVSPNGGGSTKQKFETIQSVTDFKLPKDGKYTFDFKNYREEDKCGCTNYRTVTIKHSLNWYIDCIKTTIKPSYSLERKDDMISAPTDEKKKEYIFKIENKWFKNLELDYSFERERKRFWGATTKSYIQYINSIEAKYIIIPSRLDITLKGSQDYKNPSDTNKTEITTTSLEFNYVTKSGDDRFNLKYEKKNNLYYPWSDSSAYRQQYLKFKYTKKF